MRSLKPTTALEAVKEDIDDILDSKLADFHGGSLVAAESTAISCCLASFCHVHEIPVFATAQLNPVPLGLDPDPMRVTHHPK